MPGWCAAWPGNCRCSCSCAWLLPALLCAGDAFAAAAASFGDEELLRSCGCAFMRSICGRNVEASQGVSPAPKLLRRRKDGRGVYSLPRDRPCFPRSKSGKKRVEKQSGLLSIGNNRHYPGRTRSVVGWGQTLLLGDTQQHLLCCGVVLVPGLRTLRREVNSAALADLQQKRGR